MRCTISWILVPRPERYDCKKVLQLRFFKLSPKMGNSRYIEVRTANREEQQRLFMRRVSTNHLPIRKDVLERTSSVVVFIYHGLVCESHSKVSNSCLDNRNMNITEVNGLHFLISYPAPRKKPDVYSTDVATNGRIYGLSCN